MEKYSGLYTPPVLYDIAHYLCCPQEPWTNHSLESHHICSFCILFMDVEVLRSMVSYGIRPRYLSSALLCVGGGGCGGGAHGGLHELGAPISSPLQIWITCGCSMCFTSNLFNLHHYWHLCMDVYNHNIPYTHSLLQSDMFSLSWLHLDVILK